MENLHRVHNVKDRRHVRKQSSEIPIGFRCCKGKVRSYVIDDELEVREEIDLLYFVRPCYNTFAEKSLRSTKLVKMDQKGKDDYEAV